MARPKPKIELTESQSEGLRRILKAPTSPQRMVRRASIVLNAASGADSDEIAGLLNTSRVTVGKWRSAFLADGLGGLQDRKGRGRKPRLAGEKLKTIIDGVVQPPANRKRWSCRLMARHAGVSKATVQRVWAANDLKPHLTRTFKVSTDKRFEEKFWDVIGLYLNPPDKAVVLCCDEKSQCQALERTQPGLPLKQGHIQTATHDYYRNGTLCLFAALNYLEGKVIAQTAPRHRHQEWLSFLKQIDREVPADLAVHIILDNYATHKHPDVKKWLARRKRYHLHFTPTSASWMNLVERFFREISTEVITPGSFTSVKELADAIFSYLAARNLEPRRFVWRAKGAEILEKIRRARAALALDVSKHNNETLD